MNGFQQGFTSGLLLVMVLLAFPAQAQVVKRQDVIRESGERLRAMVEKSGHGMRVERVFFRDDLTLPEGKVSWSLATDAGSLNPGRQRVAVDVAVNGKVVNTIQVTATVKQLVKYLVLRRNLKRGDVVAEGDLQWEEAELEREIPGLMQDAKGLIGQATTRSVSANKPLQGDWFAAPVVVARGDRVQVAVVQGPLRIETVGVAQAAGRVGETIVLENPESRRRYSARILGPGQAQTLTW